MYSTYVLCGGGGRGGAEIWLTGSGSEDLLRDVTLQEVGGGGGC